MASATGATSVSGPYPTATAASSRCEPMTPAACAARSAAAPRPGGSGRSYRSVTRMRDRGGAVPITTTLACGMKPSRCGMTARRVAGESALTIRSECVVCGLLSPAVQVCLIRPASGSPDRPGDEDFVWPVDNRGVIHRMEVRLDNWGPGGLAEKMGPRGFRRGGPVSGPGRQRWSDFGLWRNGVTRTGPDHGRDPGVDRDVAGGQ